MGAATVILTDIEGTTTPIAFVRDVLFPHARARLEAFIAEHGEAPAVGACLAETARLAPDRRPAEALLGWMAADAKVTPLKTLQGLIWADGYASGALKGQVYADVPPVLRRWRAEGKRLAVYSSGSEEAQRLLFGHAEAGDLSGLFSGFFDTRIGGKREADSYAAIAGRLAVPAADILFLSDIAEELDAAAAAGCRTVQLVRPADGTVASPNHPQAADFTQISGV